MSNSRTQTFSQPYPGLRPFDFDDAPLFFGRHTHVAEMLALLEEQRFLAVVGASSSGKSSLVRAGLLPAIAEGYLDLGSGAAWQRVITRPSDDPYGALADELIGLGACPSRLILADILSGRGPVRPFGRGTVSAGCALGR